ncbi:13E12 repeat family protein [Arthrobacter sp. YA7-1]|nr:13E12 repeat family protein [Arthrobacter sp. YA7-1]UYY79839.1 13E12 repeat family protein [Arthrobacter sp. YA7-1]
MTPRARRAGPPAGQPTPRRPPTRRRAPAWTRVPARGEAGSARGGEFRSTAEHLRSLLRISAADARRRLALARELLPGRSLTGETVPARHGETAAAVASGVIGSGAAGIITMAVAKVRPLCTPEKAAEMEHALARTAAENDQDFLARVARRWVEAIDQDGPEPSEESLRHHQGAFLRRPKHGLAHVEIFATAEQYEQLLTVMNTAANPRTRTPQGAETHGTEPQGTVPAWTEPSGGFFADSFADSCGGAPEHARPLDRRSRAQKLLDGLVGACRLALATGSLPATDPGHHRPTRPLPPSKPAGPRHRVLHVHRARAGRDVAEDRLRRGHHPRGPGRRRPGPGHRTGLTGLPAAYPQVHHGPGQGLRLSRMHHAGPVVRGPPHRVLVPGRSHEHRERDLALRPSPPSDPQGRLAHPGPQRHPLVHPATPHRPAAETPKKPLLPNMRPG